MKIKSIKINKHGEPVITKTKIPLHDLEIRFIDGRGEIIQPGAGIPITTHGFVAYGPGIDMSFVKSVQLPKMSYNGGDIAIAIVESYVPSED